MLLHIYCKNYRNRVGAKQSDLGNLKSISTFETGRSTNIKHFEKYIELAIKHNDLNTFLNGLGEYING